MKKSYNRIYGGSMIKELFSDLVKEKLFSDSFWNAISIAIMAVTGFLLNIILANKFGAEGLGLYYITLSIYMVVSLFGNMGVHASVLKYVPQHEGSPGLLDSIISSALFLSLFLGSLMTVALLLTSETTAFIMHNESLTAPLRTISLSLPLLAINKVLRAVLNGLRRIKAFAFTQALRWLTILTATLMIIYNSGELRHTFWAFFIAETVLLLFLGLYVTRFFNISFIDLKKWSISHIAFGIKAFLANLFTEVRTRLDIIILAVFLSEKDLGVYSFAHSINLALWYIPAIVRPSIEPWMTKLWYNNERSALIHRLKQIKFAMLIIIIISSLLVFGSFNFIVPIIFPGKLEFLDGWIPLGILLIGFIFYAPYMSFITIFNQTGHPEITMQIGLYRTLLYIPVICILVWNYGIIGGVIASSLMYIVTLLLVKWKMRAVLEMRI